MSDGTLQTLDVTMLDDVNNASGLIQLDSNAKIPACSGASITGISGVTKNASDPALDTNPSGGVGTVWQNTTSGEMFICTNATAGSNTWTNIGAGTGDIEPYSFAGLLYGYTAGGYAGGYNDTIDKFAFATSANAADVANLTRGVYASGSFGSETHGYSCGGEYGPASTRVEKWAFTSDANAVTLFDPPANSHAQGCWGTHSQTAGYISGGGVHANMSKVTFASDSSSVDWGDSTSSPGSGSGCSSTTHGWNVQGMNQGIIDRFSFASNAGASDWGDLSVNREYHWGTSSSTHGYTHGGDNTGGGVIDKFSMASQANATDVGDLVVNRDQAAGQSSATHGYSSAGGYSATNIIEKVSFASDGNSVDTTADVTLARRWCAGTEY